MYDLRELRICHERRYYVLEIQILMDLYRYNIRFDRGLPGTGHFLADNKIVGNTIFEDDVLTGAALRLPALLESHSPIDYVILMLGTNDCTEHVKLPLPVTYRQM